MRVPGAARAILVLALCCGPAAGCGGSGTTKTTTAAHAPGAKEVCAGAGRAAGRSHPGAVTVRVTDSDPTNMECRITVAGIHLDVLAAPSAQAWAEWDTTQVHQLQAYGSGAVHVPGQIPVTIMQTSILAAWIPDKREVFATNATQSRAGTYVTVTVGGRRVSQSERLRLARAVMLGTLAAATVVGRG